MNSSRVCHAQIITELLRVSLLVWEATREVEIDKAVELASGGLKNNLSVMDILCTSVWCVV